MAILRSMTGFGAAAAEVDEFSVRIEVRSVNHRHLQVKTRLSSEFVHLEGDADKLIRKELVRGSVAVHLHATRRPGTEAARIDRELAGRYKKELVSLARDLGCGEVLDLSTVLALPGVVTTREESKASEARDKRVLKVLRTALAGLLEMRDTEGAALLEDLRGNARELEAIAGRIAKRMPQVTKGHQRTLTKRVKDLLDRTADLSPADLAREVALLADRLDVSEELSRLSSHLGQLESFLAKGGAVGRKLDFLVQEIFREVNTVGAKCSDAKVAHWVVDAKACAERLREQVQNVE